MKIKYLFIILLLPISSFSQIFKDKDYEKDSIYNDIFRIVCTKSIINSVSFQYEKKVKKAITLLVEAGPTLEVQPFGALEDPSKSKYQFSFSFFGSLESRYYFNLKHRIKKQKSVHNYSAFYFSLQEYVLANPFGFINQRASNSYQGNLQTFINIGWQKQYQSLYFHAFLGAAISRKTFSKFYPDQYIQGSQSGLSFGIVL